MAVKELIQELMEELDGPFEEYLSDIKKRKKEREQERGGGHIEYDGQIGKLRKKLCDQYSGRVFATLKEVIIVRLAKIFKENDSVTTTELFNIIKIEFSEEIIGLFNISYRAIVDIVLSLRNLGVLVHDHETISLEGLEPLEKEAKKIKKKLEERTKV